MTTIELHHDGNGAPIVGSWEGVGATYLVGRSGGMCWSPRIQSGDMPLAVLSSYRAGVYVAPVHPLCHVGAAGQVVTPMASGEMLQLGVDKYRLKVTSAHFRKRQIYMALLMGAVFAAALMGGWYLRGAMGNPPAATSSDLYTF